MGPLIVERRWGCRAVTVGFAATMALTSLRDQPIAPIAVDSSGGKVPSMAVNKRSPKGRLLLRLKQASGAGHRSMYRLSGGRMGGSVRGVPVLLLTTTGRKTGQHRTVPLVYDEKDGAFVVASSNAGHWEPAWLLNLRADPNVFVEVGRRRFEAVAEIVDGEAGAALWKDYEKLHPSYPAYRESRGVDFPMVVLRAAE